jgi:FkbM family methyltransferase
MHHPIGSRHRLEVLRRFVHWQAASRLAGCELAVPFVGNARFLVSTGQSGATGNLYVGLHEFEHMGFVLHLLDTDSVFVDVGANVGSYTLLAAAVRGARVFAFEPVPIAFARLRNNVRINDAEDLVVAVQGAVSNAPGTLRFTANLDSMNRVATTGDETATTIAVSVTTLDEALAGVHPTLLKIDTEGHERQVLEGAKSVLEDSSLLGLIVETGSRSGTGARLASFGFVPWRYDPFSRVLVEGWSDSPHGNQLFVRDIHTVRRRVRNAPAIDVLGDPI